MIHHPWTSAHISKYDDHGDIFSVRFVTDMSNDVEPSQEDGEDDGCYRRAYHSPG